LGSLADQLDEFNTKRNEPPPPKRSEHRQAVDGRTRLRVVAEDVWWEKTYQMEVPEKIRNGSKPILVAVRWGPTHRLLGLPSIPPEQFNKLMAVKVQAAKPNDRHLPTHLDDMMLLARTANMAAQDADPEEVSRPIELGDAQASALKLFTNNVEGLNAHRDLSGSASCAAILAVRAVSIHVVKCVVGVGHLVSPLAPLPPYKLIELLPVY